MKMHSKSRSNLFIIELLSAILIFALCAGICMKLFAEASVDLRRSERILLSVSGAENTAELYKHYSGNLDMIAKTLGGNASGNSFTVFYDKDWNRCASCSSAYMLTVTKENYSELGKATITVISCDDGEKLISLTVSTYGGEIG